MENPEPEGWERVSETQVVTDYSLLTATCAPDPLSCPKGRTPGAPNCIAVASYGKSGSKRMLRMLDFSPDTHCRNEPYGLEHSAMGELWRRVLVCRGTAEIEELLHREWWSVARQTHACKGNKDRLPSPPKSYETRWARPLGLVGLVSSRRARRLLGVLMPGLQRDEWPASGIVWSSRALSRAMLVVKLNHGAQMAPAIVRAIPDMRVVHIIRHPSAMLRSWRDRLLAVSDEDAVLLANRARLQSIASAAEEWRERFGDIHRMSAAEAELWHWRYRCEELHVVGRGRSNYLLVRDEDVMLNAHSVASEVYSFAGLPVADQVREYLAAWAPRWSRWAIHWRESMSAPDIELVERILSDSLLRTLWSPTELVSDYRYSGV